MSRVKPFSATIKERYLLTKPESTKETWHIVLDISGSDLTFKVGDSLGIYGDNDPILVDRLLRALAIDPEKEIVHPRTEERLSFKTFLTQKANIGRLNSPFLKIFGLEQSHHTDLIDFIEEQRGRPFDLIQLIAAFSPLLPRFYSVASSPALHPTEVHLTVAVSTYTHNGELRYGVASHFLAHLADIGTTPIPCYIQPALHFWLPEDHSKDIIMVGPGTGVAPFRGFLQERLFHQAPGKNWLFFGERHQKHDFFYETFWQELVDQNKLALDLAFSRDQEEKVYVQHKLLEKGAEIWSWISQGAHFYVCGDADPMAKDVEAALKSIFQEHGSLSESEAHQFLKQLRKEKRFLADVY